MNERKRSTWEREIINVSLNKNKKKEWNKDIREEKDSKKENDWRCYDKDTARN